MHHLGAPSTRRTATWLKAIQRPAPIDALLVLVFVQAVNEAGANVGLDLHWILQLVDAAG
jgi:hypothetical protein